MPKNTLGFESVGLKLMSMSQTLPANKGLLAQSTAGKKRSVGGGDVPVVLANPGLFSWGNNSSGELGLGNTTSYSSPKQVGSLTTWATVSDGVNLSLAIKT